MPQEAEVINCVKCYRSAEKDENQETSNGFDNMEIIGEFDKRDFVKRWEQKSAVVGSGMNVRNGMGMASTDYRQDRRKLFC